MDLHQSEYSILSDHVSGSMALCFRSLVHLQKLAEGSTSYEAFENKASHFHNKLTQAHPSMHALHHLWPYVRRFLDGSSSEPLGSQLSRFVEKLNKDVDRVVHHAALRIRPGERILTISASSMVEKALVHAAQSKSFEVFCLESKPEKEGWGLAARLQKAGLSVYVYQDAAIGECAAAASQIWMGCDAYDARCFINKTGSLGLALAAGHFQLPVYVISFFLDQVSSVHQVSLPKQSMSREIDGEKVGGVVSAFETIERFPWVRFIGEGMDSL